MQPTSVQSIVFAPLTATPLPPLVFGFPRAWLLRQLRARLTEQLCIGLTACACGYRDARGTFAQLDDGDDYDGPEFVLRLSYASTGQALREHDIALHVTISNNHYQLQAAGRHFDIAFLPTTDTAHMASAARWLQRSLDKPLQAR